MFYYIWRKAHSEEFTAALELEIIKESFYFPLSFAQREISFESRKIYLLLKQ